jgi:molybdopterin-dependent oxidoreductase alpha subunit
MNDTPPSAEPPVELDGLGVSAPKTVAAGVPAVVQSFRHLWGEMGVVRGTKAMLRLNQVGGFDCMSCAWPDPDDHRSAVEFCENGAKAVAWEGTRDRCGPEFFAKHSVKELANESDYWHGQQGRLTHPMVLRKGATHYEPIAWDDAFRLIADELKAAPPDESVFYTSGRTSNEAAFLYQLFARLHGTNNLPDCSNMCHESSGSALSATVGIGKGTVTLADFEKAQLILILGQNPGTNHPRMLTTLQAAKRAGAAIVAINPLPEAGLLRFKHPQEVFNGLLGSGTPLADLFLPVRIGGDQALLKGIVKELLDADAIDRGFVEAKTTGFEACAASARETPWDGIVEQSGLTREQIRAVAGLVTKSDHVIACWAMGLTQHKHAVATIQELVNVLLMRGSVGKPGAGLCPVRGHSNVQGDRTMGIVEKPAAWFLDALAKEFAFDPPRHHGYDTVEAIQAMHAGRVRVFFALGGNFLSATPDTHFTAEALRKCKLTVHVSTKLHRGHLVTGEQALILPCLGRTERDLQDGRPQVVTCENSMGVVQTSEGTFPPASEHLLSEVAIVARLAKAAVPGRGTIDWDAVEKDYDRVRDHIARVIPGFGNFNERVRKPGGFYLPNGPRDGDFKTPGGKAVFTANALHRIDLAPGELLMMTIRTHDQFNTTVYGLDDRYRGIKHGRRVVFLNEADVAERGLKAGDVVDLVGHFRGVTRVAEKFAVVPYPIPRRCAATYFPETNVLVPIDSTADVSNTPTSKSVVITLRRQGRPGLPT